MRNLKKSRKSSLQRPLKDKIVIVTGGGRGIGAATAIAFARAGARVALCSRTTHQLRSTKLKVQKESAVDRVMAVSCDIRSERQVRKFFAKVVRVWGRPDILINNAAIVFKKDLKKTTLSEWQNLISVNLTGTFLCSREVARVMSRGCIINISSLAGLRGVEKFRGLGAYTASKFGVVGLTEVLALELAPKIRVNCIAPGAVNTEMLQKAAPHLKTRTTPYQVAEFILKLALKPYTGRVLALNANL